MALIPCPDCENQISDSAPACIHCGRVNREINFNSQQTVTIQKTDRGLKQWKSLFFGLMIISIAMMSFGWGKVASVLFIVSLLGWAYIRHLIYYRNR